jgi:hypothetical protein
MTLRYTNEAEVLPTATTVRQGVTGHNVRYAWAFSLAGIICAFALVAFFGG